MRVRPVIFARSLGCVLAGACVAMAIACMFTTPPRSGATPRFKRVPNRDVAYFRMSDWNVDVCALGNACDRRGEDWIAGIYGFVCDTESIDYTNYSKYVLSRIPIGE